MINPVCRVVQTALWHTIVRPAQTLAEACIRRAISLLQTARGRSMADHMAVIGAEAAAAGLHVVYGLPAGNAAEAHVAACCCMQVSCLPCLGLQMQDADSSLKHILLSLTGQGIISFRLVDLYL